FAMAARKVPEPGGLGLGLFAKYECVPVSKVGSRSIRNILHNHPDRTISCGNCGVVIAPAGYTEASAGWITGEAILGKRTFSHYLDRRWGGKSLKGNRRHSGVPVGSNEGNPNGAIALRVHRDGWPQEVVAVQREVSLVNYGRHEHITPKSRGKDDIGAP